MTTSLTNPNTSRSLCKTEVWKTRIILHKILIVGVINQEECEKFECKSYYMLYVILNGDFHPEVEYIHLLVYKQYMKRLRMFRNFYGGTGFKLILG